ncbi:MAG: hypothetical protein IE890_04240 [Arcobacter sp.]|nr:hypothetical protein [Arcobacter sp.]
MGKIPVQYHFNDRAGYIQFDTETNKLEVKSDGEFIEINSAGGIPPGTDTILTVGSTGDYATIEDAIDYLQSSNIVTPINKSVTIEILDGITSQVEISNADLSYLKITGSFMTNLDDVASPQTFSYNKNGITQTITPVFILKNVKGLNLDIDSINDGFNDSSVVYAENSDFSLNIAEGGEVGIYLKNSKLNSLTSISAVFYAIIAENSIVNVSDANIRSSFGIVADSSQVYAANADAAEADNPHSSSIHYRIFNGGIVYMDSNTFGLGSETKNTISANGIIFDPRT